ncbi:MAG: response regulator [Cytophagales bacterium]|nr:response regulator [Cytophagales bacterium]
MSTKYSCIIVEDDEDFAEMLQQYLVRIGGLDVLAVHGDTTKAALDIEKLKPDVIFLDINISGLEGPEFMELVEHRPQIIVCSGHPPSVMSNYDIEIAEYLQKPFTRDQLEVAVKRCIASL